MRIIIGVIAGIFIGVILAIAYVFEHVMTILNKSNDMGDYKATTRYYVETPLNVRIRLDDTDAKMW